MVIAINFVGMKSVRGKINTYYRKTHSQNPNERNSDSQVTIGRVFFFIKLFLNYH